MAKRREFISVDFLVLLFLNKVKDYIFTLDIFSNTRNSLQCGLNSKISMGNQTALTFEEQLLDTLSVLL